MGAYSPSAGADVDASESRTSRSSRSSGRAADDEVKRPADARRRGGGCMAALVGMVVAAGLLAAAAGGWLMGAMAPEPQTTTVVNPGPPVVVAVRELARLQTAEYRMERVIDLRDKQEHLWGMLKSEDAILLVASARVTAGVDLRALPEHRVEVDHAAKWVRIELPPAQVFDAALDNERTYVHRRDTDLLADRHESLETRARQQAEKHLVDAARKAGLLRTAEDNAVRTVKGLLHTLGFEQVTVTIAR